MSSMSTNVNMLCYSDTQMNRCKQSHFKFNVIIEMKGLANSSTSKLEQFHMKLKTLTFWKPTEKKGLGREAICEPKK